MHELQSMMRGIWGKRKGGYSRRVEKWMEEGRLDRGQEDFSSESEKAKRV